MTQNQTLFCLKVAFVVTGLAGTGCQIAPHGHHAVQTREAARGTITTGGYFARSQVIEIPSGGLALVDAVEQSLRPGLRQCAVVEAPQVRGSQASLAAPTVSAAKFIKEVVVFRQEFDLSVPDDREDFKAAVKSAASHVTATGAAESDVVGGKTWFQHVVFCLIDSQDDVIKNQGGSGTLTEGQQRLARLVDIIAAGDPDAPGASAAQPSVQANDAVYNIALESHKNTFDQSVIENVTNRLSSDQAVKKAISCYLSQHPAVLREIAIDGGLTVRQKRLAQTVNALMNFNDTSEVGADAPSRSGGGPDAEQRSQLPPAQSGATPFRSELAVVVTRPGEARKILPLSLVELTPAGDVLLQDGDRVEVTSYSRTSLGMRSEAVLRASDRAGKVAVVGLVNQTVALPEFNLAMLPEIVDRSEFGDAVDLVVLRASSGSQTEEYWIPLPKPASFAVPISGMNEFVILPRDTVEVTALELVPLVRGSRLRRRLEGIEEKHRHFDGLGNEALADVAERDRALAEQFRTAPAAQTLGRGMRQLGRFLRSPL